MRRPAHDRHDRRAVTAHPASTDPIAPLTRSLLTEVGEDPVLVGLATWVSVLHYLGETTRTAAGLIVVLDVGQRV